MSRAARTTRALLGLALAGATLTACSATSAITTEANCPVQERDLFVLAAQAVPSATLLPCIVGFPAGWWYGGSDVRSGEARFWLESDRAGFHAVEVALTPACRISGAVDVTNATDEVGVRVYLEEFDLDPFSANRYFLFSGGCVTYRYRFAPGAEPTLALEADEAITFGLRTLVVEKIRRELDLTLCGASAPACVDET